jgi:hypothetical protein
MTVEEEEAYVMTTEQEAASKKKKTREETAERPLPHQVLRLQSNGTLTLCKQVPK